MLIEKPIDVNDIVIMKMSNGDEIIAKVVVNDFQYVTVSKPLIMLLSQDPTTGRPGIQMAPFWLLGADPESRCPISRNHVIVLVKASADAAKGYLAQTTGLAMPNSSSIIT